MALVIEELKELSEPMLELSGFDKDLIIEPDEKDDEVPEVPTEPQSKLGDLYELGQHRVLCGDSTKIEDVERLMDGKKADMVFTDPPYGMNLDTEYVKNGTVKGNTYDKVIGDDRDFNYQDFSWIDCTEQFWWGADYYAKTLPNKGSWFVWDKKKEDLDASIGSGFEICWSKTPHKKEMIRILWSGFTAKERNESRSHPTQKPVELCKWFISKYSDKSDNILDLFLGSGSTLIAAQKTGRICYGMELDCKYVDVCIERWCKYTGITKIKKNGEDYEWQLATEV
jgi:DNA modification methylase